MAKFRFPGKALKLNYRKRVKFRFEDDISPDEQRTIQIKAGLLLFNQLFGESDEDDEFDGFGSSDGKTMFKTKKPKIKRSLCITEVPPSLDHETEPSSPVKEDEGESISKVVIPIPLVNGLSNDKSAQESVIEKETVSDSVQELKTDSHLSKINSEKLKNGKKVKESNERTSKKFVLPMVSARSSRIIKPNKRLFSDFTSLCSTNQQNEESKQESSEKITDSVSDVSPKVKVKHNDPEVCNTNSNEETESDPVCRSIMFYTDSITEEFKGQVGRPPKRLVRKGEAQSKEEFTIHIGSNASPSKELKEEKVKEKIEKLLRSPWDNRIKQSSKIAGKEKDQPSVTVPLCNATLSKSILRKARLNLSKKTLQKIRSPASVQRLVPLSEEETAESKCGLCQCSSCNTLCRYGVSCCETCHLSINYFTDDNVTNLECLGGQGECQLVGLPTEERCMACWLSRILLTCAMPSLLHDRLRKRLPPNLKEKIPTSLGRSLTVNTVTPEEITVEGKGFSGDSGTGGFGSLVDLPGGWKRKTGSELLVISPSGEKFRSISRLEEYLKRQGINAQASVLFGNLNSKSIPNLDAKSELKQPSKPLTKTNNVVVTTLPGGWTRRIKWRSSGDRFDTYVCSPDGRTFRSRKELSSYFQHIGKVDDIHKYFPVINSSASCANSSENSEASSTEPFSSSEACSEGSSTDEKSQETDSDNDILSTNLKDYEEPLKAKANSVRTSVQSDCAPEDNTRVESPSRTVSPRMVDKPTSPSHTSQTVKPLSPSPDKATEKLIISNFNNQVKFTNGASSGELEATDTGPPSLGGKATFIEVSNPSERDNPSLVASSDSDSPEDDNGGVNLNLFNNSGKREVNKEDKIILKINKKSLESHSLIDTTSVKHKKRKKKKRRHEKRLKKEALLRKNTLEKENDLVCDVDKINTKVSVENISDFVFSKTVEPVVSVPSEKNNLSVFSTTVEPVVSVPSEKNNLSVFSKTVEPDSVPSEKNNLSVFSVPTEKTSIQSIFKDVELSSVLCHPNDTWQTLISQTIPAAADNSDAKEKGFHSVKEYNCSNTQKEETPVLDKPLREQSTNSPVKPRKVKKFKRSGFTTQQFGNGWSRKVKWNDKGQGKISFLTSPDGQKIVSSIELLAYFKKAGKSLLDMDYYFPKDLVRECIKKVEPMVEEPSNKEILNRLTPTLTIREKIEERKRERKVMYKQPRGKMKKGLKVLQPRYSRVNLGQTSDGRAEKVVGGGGPTEIESPPVTDAGPRVKHVCRSQAQVLGMPRAVFPSPKEDKANKKKIVCTGKKSKFLTVSTPKGKRVLKKTLWCSKCPGCATPNCKVCVNCIDMKKYGGPGTKKKPCVMRKCYNPLRAIKHVQEPSVSNSTEDKTEETREKEEFEKSSNMEDSCMEVGSFSTPAGGFELESDGDFGSLNGADSLEDKQLETDEGDEELSSAEKSIFVPKMMIKPLTEPKDKCDIQAGKECIPGTRVNIDYWQAYDAEEMLMSGFPIITSVPLQLDSFCFRCGSSGMEQLLYCIWCCEGIHPFCLEEGEGPDNDEEEALWVCKKCAVCHVCGGSGHYDLLQCSGCRRHYHMECLGPSSHESCQPPQDGVWMAESLRLLSLSWPKQTPIIDVSEFCIGDCMEESVTLLEELESLQPSSAADQKERAWETSLLPLSLAQLTNSKMPGTAWPSTEKKRNLVECVKIEDTLADLEEEDHICLEDAFDDFEEMHPVNLPKTSEISSLPKEDEVVHFLRDIDVVSLGGHEGERDAIGMEVDEYLSLKYKKILPFTQKSIEASLVSMLLTIQSELFEVLGYMSWPEMFSKKLVPKEHFKDFKVPEVDPSTKDVESPIDLKSTLLIRRAEVQQVIKTLEEIRIQEEKRIKEIQRELSRKRRLELGKEGNEKELLKSRGKFKKRRFSQQSNTNIFNRDDPNEAFVEYEIKDRFSEEAYGMRWQPQSWEEFDALFESSYKVLETDDPSASTSKDIKNEIDEPPKQGILKGVKSKRGRPCSTGSPGMKKAKKLKLSRCSVKVSRLEFRKWKLGKKSLSPKKRLFSSPQKLSPKQDTRKRSPKLASPKVLAVPEPLSDLKKEISIGNDDYPQNTAEFGVGISIEPENMVSDETAFEITIKDSSESGMAGVPSNEQLTLVEKREELEDFSMSVSTPWDQRKDIEFEETIEDLCESLKESSNPVVSKKSKESRISSKERKKSLKSSNRTSKDKNLLIKKVFKHPLAPSMAPGDPGNTSENALIDPNKSGMLLVSSKGEGLSTRPRRTSFGRASELASLRKAMLDIN